MKTTTTILPLAILLVALAGGNLAFCGEIHDAAKIGDLEKVKALLKVNPDLVSSRDDDTGATPLHAAALMDHKDIAEFLLANKADVNAKNSYGYTPLDVSTIEGHGDMTELLRQYGGQDATSTHSLDGVATPKRQRESTMNNASSQQAAIEEVIKQMNDAGERWTNSMIELQKDPITTGFTHRFGDTIQKYHDDLVAIDISNCPDDFRIAFVKYYQAVGKFKSYANSITGLNGVLKGLGNCIGSLIQLHDNTDKAEDPVVEAGNEFEQVCTKYHVDIK